MANKVKSNKNKSKKSNKKVIDVKTHTGHPLTNKESKFIDEILKGTSQRQACLKAGYSSKYPDQYANGILKKPYIAEEIKYRTEQRQKDSIATGQEVMEYFTKVMKGEIKDQFGLDAPLSERTKAAQELARRTVDIENRLKGKDADNKITLVIERRK